MPLTTINEAKDSTETYQPLLLAVITFTDASVLRLCTKPLSTAQGGYQYGGQNYDGRILDYDLGSIQGNDPGGIDIVPRASITIADPDKAIKTGYEDVKGFGYATLALTFLLWDADSATFSSDSIAKFSGICDAAQCDEKTLTLTATNKLALQRRTLPAVPLQRRCPWLFPSTAAQRQEAADNEDSPYYACGYSHDASGGNARGNSGYTTCDYTKAACVARGMYKLDSLSRVTGRFGGSQYEAQQPNRSREYTSGKWLDIQGNPNEARYGSPIPMVYGTAWVDPIVMPLFGDGNSTRFEAIVCLGEVNYIHRVVVNDVELQPATDVTGGTNYIVHDPLLRYNVINRGGRDGAPNADTFYGGNGDPYGSMCAILCVVPRRVVEASGSPRVRVLLQGPKVRVYTGVSTYSSAYSANPVWVLMDLLIWSGLKYADLGIQSFIDAAAICDTSISYTDQFGASSSHARYSCSLVINQRRSAADAIRAVRQGFGGVLIPNSSTGLIDLYVEGTLASQQPSAVDGSNYNTAISSLALTGGATNGYVAYDFTKFLTDSGRSSFKVSTPPISQSANRVEFGFVNSERDHAADSISRLDVNASALASAEVVERLDADGINTFDQAKRISKRRLARNLYGNARGDSKGTELFEWRDSFRAVKVRAGHIVRISNAHYGISNVLARVLQISPSKDFETATIVAQRHSDSWYVDTYGQEADPATSTAARNRLERPPYPWGPAGATPHASDPILDETDQTFTLAEVHETAADGTVITRLDISGNWPVNIFADLAPPIVARQGTTASSGGNFPGSGRTYYVAIVATNSSGGASAPSTLCEIVVTDASTTNTVTAAISGWPSGATGYIAYCGDTPQKLTKHSSSATTPSSVTLTAFKKRAEGIPDPEFDRVRIKVKRVAHSGVWGRAVDVVGAGTFEITGAGWTVNQWSGYDISVLGIAAGGNLGVLNYRVSSNTADVLTVTPDPNGIVAAGDALIMRSKPTVGVDGGGNYLSDALWQNTLEAAGAGLTVNEEVGRLLRITTGPGANQVYRIISNTATKVYIEGAWLSTPDSTSRYIIEEPDWQVNVTGDSLNNADTAETLYLSTEVSNYLQSVVLVEAVMVDGGDHESFETFNPRREIYLFGASSPAAPDNVSGLSATYEYADAETVRVQIAYTQPSPVGSFVGVHVWEEPVDQSASAAIPLNGTVALNGSANLGGTFAPIDRGRHLTSPAAFYIPRPTDTATKRFYLASYSETAENELARATESNATPNITVSVSANSYQSGEEYARLVTGVGATVAYDDSQVSSPKYRFLFAWTAPTDPPAAWQMAFGGVQIVYEYADGNRANGPILAVNETSRYSDWYELFVGSAVVKCWFVSMDASAEPRLNSIIENLTPSASATVTWPLASRGGVSPYADNVTGFAASNARYATNGQGLKVLLIDFAWTKPSTAAALARWGGVIVWLHLPGGGAKFQLTGPETGATITCEIGAFPQSTETWTFYGISVDNNANPNADGQNPISGTPSATLSVSPPTAGASGTEYTSHATSVSFAAATVSASDGTTQKRVTATFTGPSDVTWGGVELRVYDGSTLLASTSATPSPVAVVFPNPSSSVTVTAKLVSFDVNGRTNTEQAGTPQGTLAIGSASGTLDGAKLTVSSVSTASLNSTEIQVGGGGSKPGKFGVYNSSGTQIGFIGTESGNEGGWFKTLSVGGSSYANGKLKADSSGGVTINDATLTLNLNGVVATISNDLAYGVYNGIRVYSTTSGQESPVMISPGGITIGNTLTTGTKFYLNAAYGSNATMSLYDSTTAERIRLSTSTSNGAIRVYGSGSSFASLNDTTLALLSGGYVDAGGYRVGGSAGVSGSVNPITGINTNLVTINYKDHSGNNQTASFLAFSSTTTATLTFSGGIRV